MVRDYETPDEVLYDKLCIEYKSSLKIIFDYLYGFFRLNPAKMRITFFSFLFCWKLTEEMAKYIESSFIPSQNLSNLEKGALLKYTTNIIKSICIYNTNKIWALLTRTKVMSWRNVGDKHKVS